MTWPAKAEQYGTYPWFLGQVGGALGYGFDPATYDHRQHSLADSFVQRGLQAFYSPPVLPGDRYAHEWSFLRPQSSVNTVSGTSDYDLPEDFGMLDGPMVFTAEDSVLYEPIKIVAPHQIEAKRTSGTYTARPEVAAIRPKALDATQATRYEVMFWPTPNGAYQLLFYCRLNPAILSDEKPHPHGGRPHVETILESCLTLVDQEKGKNQGHAARFLERLQASVSHDRRLGSPDTLGYNWDRSDHIDPRDWHDRDENVVTYNDVAY